MLFLHISEVKKTIIGNHHHLNQDQEQQAEMCACRYIRSRYGSSTPPPMENGPAGVYAQEMLDDYYTPGPVSRSSSSYDLSGGVREQGNNLACTTKKKASE